jgi:hypothetical protein
VIVFGQAAHDLNVGAVPTVEVLPYNRVQSLKVVMLNQVVSQFLRESFLLVV